MKTNRVHLLLPGTALVAALGLLLPGVVLARVQNAAMAGVKIAEIGTAVSADTVSTYETKALSLETVTRVVKGGTYESGFEIYYHEPGPGSMVEPEALSRLRQEVVLLTQTGLLPEGSDDFTGAQYTAILASYGAKPGQEQDRYDVWDISVFRQEFSLSAALHAESGKLLSLAVSVNVPRDKTPETERSSRFMDRFVASDAAYAFADYLGFSGFVREVTGNDQDDMFVSCVLENGISVDCYYWLGEDGAFYLSYDLSV